MMEDERLGVIKRLLFDYVKSPSIAHIRDPYSVVRLAQEILKSLERPKTTWRKWNPERETFLRSAVTCWVPTQDLRAYLNGMPGAKLSASDVEQRLRSFEDELFQYPNDDYRSSCLALQEREKAEGTELPAIIQLLREHVEKEDARTTREEKESHKQSLEEERLAREQRLLAGADCGWTRLRNSLNWYCRANGRVYRLSPTKDGKWTLERVNSTSDEEEGGVIGKYQNKRSASATIKKIAYEPEPRW